MRIPHILRDIIAGCSRPGLVLLCFTVKDIGEELVQEGTQLIRGVLDSELAVFIDQSKIRTDVLHEDSLEGGEAFGPDPLCEREHLSIVGVLALTPGQEGGVNLTCPSLTLGEPCDLVTSPWFESSATVLSSMA